MNKKIKRLDNNIYALDMAYKRLQNSLNSNEEKDIYSAVGELLLWVLTTDEWHREHNDRNYENRLYNDDNGQVLLGLRYAYNLMKHNMDFYDIHNKIQGGVFLPAVLPIVFPPPTVYWRFLDEDMESGYKNQVDNYKKHIQGREIITTFDNAIAFLNKENDNIKKKHGE
jgi:hypothetical protein|nr:MAG TPA: hypothetical protein [Caudoviricetes sp.]